jgi:4-hydroxy-4-methyl-2-oxoglutarate aldolase
VNPRDSLFWDIDGILVVPARVEVEVLTRALERARGEKVVKAELEAGSTAVAVFQRHGIM